jgi:hypothetical protein
MTVSEEVPLGFGLFQLQGVQTDRRNKEREMLNQFTEEGATQWMPRQRRDVQYVTRMEVSLNSPLTYPSFPLFVLFSLIRVSLSYMHYYPPTHTPTHTKHTKHTH